MFLKEPANHRLSRATLVALNERIAVFGLYLFALGIWLGPALSSTGVALVMLMFTVRPRAWHWAMAAPLFWICAAGIIYILVRTQLAVMEAPETEAMQWNYGLAWIQLLMFSPVAWVISLRPSGLRVAAILAAVGLLIGSVMALDASTLAEIGGGGRFGGYWNRSVVYAFYISIVLLGIAVWGGDAISAEGAGSKRMTRFVVILLWVAVVFLVWAFFASKSRGPLLGLLLVLPVAVIWRYWSAGAGVSGRRILIWGFLLTALVVAALNAGPVLERVRTDGGAAWRALEQGLDTVPLTASTLRLHMWRYGLERWSEQPLLGWGPGSVEPLLSASEDPALNFLGGEPWDHLHSAYVQALFTLGIIGVLVLGGVVAALIWPIWQGYRDGRIRREDAIFFICGFALIAIYSTTDFRHLNHDWRMFWLLFAGMAHSCGRTLR